MHNSQGGEVVTPTPGDALLKAQDPSSTCNLCHAGYGQFAGGEGYGSGGDFAWLTKTFTWTAHGHAYSSDGGSHGHSITAAAQGLTPTTEGETLTEAPGGDYLTANLGCQSCHDPHGTQGNALLLYGAEDTPKGFTFANDAPVLVSAGRRTVETGANTDEKHTAFGSGMSLWCANCHEDFYNDDTANNGGMHPTGRMIGDLATAYNGYLIEGQTAAYSELVPFETGDLDDSTLDTTSTEGPTGTSLVMCLSCHRAHASAFPDAARWDMAETLLFESHPNGDDDGSTADDKLNSYYGRTWTDNGDDSQRSLCNKCHPQDAN
jgi:cytochrome c553